MRIEEQTLAAFLDDLAAKSPTPGGGAVAALASAVAASLARMVVSYSIGKKSLASFDALHQQTLEQLESMGRQAMALAEADAIAYGKLNDLWKLDKADPRRLREFPQAVQAAIDAPMAVIDSAESMLRLLKKLVGATNTMLASDLAIAAILAEAAARAAAWNVRINLPQVADLSLREAQERRVQESLDAARSLCSMIEQACNPA